MGNPRAWKGTRLTKEEGGARTPCLPYKHFEESVEIKSFPKEGGEGSQEAWGAKWNTTEWREHIPVL